MMQEQPITGICDLDPDKIPREFKREDQDWLVVYNPKAPRLLNVEHVKTIQQEDLQTSACRHS